MADGDYAGDDRFTFRVSDGVFDSNVAAVSLTVSPINDAPRILSPDLFGPMLGIVTGAECPFEAHSRT